MKTNYVVRCAGPHVAIADVTKVRHRIYEVNRINVPPAFRGRGFGRMLLKQLLEDADQHNVTLRLAVNPSGGLGKRKLTAWYARNAFIQREDGYMYREPRTPPDHPADTESGLPNPA
jgi:GNAT superfamily N-acetyltransferase